MDGMSEEDSNINVEKVVKHWVETSEDDFQTMLKLYESESYGWSLFLGHISIEKLLKGLYVKRLKKHAPFTHNLYRLVDRLQLDITKEQEDWLYHITAFNLNARYDDYKKEFHSICTREYTQNWIERIKILRSWIIKKF